jgi:hypothetical protein
MTVRDYFDIRCGDDLDPFCRDARPLEVLAQDVYHMLITNKFALLRDPDWGFGLESYIGKQLPATLAADIVNAIRRDDRVSDAKCAITPVPGEADSLRDDPGHRGGGDVPPARAPAHAVRHREGVVNRGAEEPEELFQIAREMGAHAPALDPSFYTPGGNQSGGTADFASGIPGIFIGTGQTGQTGQ